MHGLESHHLHCWIVTAGLTIIYTTLLVGANLAYGRILGEVNAQEPAERQIRLGDRRKTFYVVWRHAELFPTEDRKRSILRVLGLSGILALLTFCVAVITCFGSVVNR